MSKNRWRLGFRFAPDPTEELTENLPYLKCVAALPCKILFRYYVSVQFCLQKPFPKWPISLLCRAGR